MRKHLREDYLLDQKKHLIETQKIGVSEATLPHVNMSLEASVICSLNEKHSEKAACTRAAAEQFFILPLFGYQRTMDISHRAVLIPCPSSILELSHSFQLHW